MNLRYYILRMFIVACLLAIAHLADAQCTVSLSTSLTTTLPEVCSGSNGNLTINFSGGTAPYTFTLSHNGTPLFTDSANESVEYSGLASGTYVVNVTDFTGCTTSQGTSISTTPISQVSILGPAAVCQGAPTTIAATGTPGSYFWNTGETSSALIVTPQSPTIYMVTLTDANGCTASAVKSLGIIASPVVTVFGDTTLCQHQASSIGVFSPGQVDYLWSNGDTASVMSFQNDLAGIFTYTVTVSNASGCTASGSVTINVLSQPTANISGNTNICMEGGTTLTASGGSAYLWNTGATTADIFVNPQNNTTYRVTVTNAGGCSASALVVVSPAVRTSTQVINADCTEGSSGSINLTVQGNGAPYEYFWSNSAVTEDLNNVPGGIYTVTVTDMNGCTNTAQAAVGVQMSLSVQVTHVTCQNPNAGSIDLSVTGGVSPYQYFWSTGQTAQDHSNLTPGTYTVTVQDNNNCTKTISTTIIVASNLVITAAPVLLNCSGTADVDITVTGGTAPYAYNWTGPNGFTVNTEDLTAITLNGNYTLTVTDAGGCSKVFSITVILDQVLNATAQVTDASCNGADGSINVTVTGGSGIFGFLWTNSAVSQNLNGLSAGIYTVTVTDFTNGCTATVASTVQTVSDIIISGVPTMILCNGGTNGAIDITTTGSAPPFTFLWSNNATTEDISGLTAGVYTVTVSDVAGCVRIQAFTITEPGALLPVFTFTNPGCAGANTGVGAIAVFGGTPPYTFDWAHIPGSSDPEFIGNAAAGVYPITVTDSQGCTIDTSMTLTDPAPIIATLQITPVCGSTSVIISGVAGGTVPFTYSWSNGGNTPVNVFYESGDYTCTITDAGGCTAIQMITVDVTPSNSCSYFSGQVVIDANQNCVNDAESGLANWIVRATGNTVFYALTDANGFYNIGVDPGENYLIEAIPPGQLWIPCPAAIFAAPVNPDTITGIDLPVKELMLCAEMEVSLSSGNLRRCFTTNYYAVSYCNNGTAPAENAYIVLSMDALSTPLSSNLSFTSLGNNNYQFNIGDVGIGQCGSFSVYFSISCNAVLGQTICADAHIYPDTTCVPANPLWSGASLALSSICETDSLRFGIKNIGFGPMSQALDYIVVEDHVMLFANPVQLNPNQSTTVSVPSNGSTWRIAIPQEPFHPGNSQPSLTVEGCTTTGSFSTGFFNQFAQNEADPWIDIDCKAITGSYDPNDKQGFPEGYGEQHYIEPGTQIEYLIRFQNTGNDTAFVVKIIDSLSQWLDPATIRPGAASHPYTFGLDGTGVASFTFDNILLPDSNVNEVASHGFVKFSIYPKADIPLETVIENTAEIYFDFNEAIVTNTTFHTIGDHFITVGLWQPENPVYQVQVAPNPTRGEAVITVKGLPPGAIDLKVTDAYGRIVLTQHSDDNNLQINGNALPAGLYYFQVMQNEKPVGSGKIVVAFD